jgi:hypothetical protein
MPLPDDLFPGKAPAGASALPDDLFGANPAAPKRITPADLKLGSTDDEIIQAFGYDPALIKKSRYYKEGDLSGNITDPNGVVATMFGRGARALDPAVAPYQPLTQPVGGFLHGLTSAARGGAQMLTRAGRAVGANSDADVAYKDLAQKFAEWDYKTNWLHGQEASLPAKTLDLAGTVMGTPAPPVTKAATLGGRAALGAVAGGLGALTQPVDVDPNDPNSYAKQKGEQVGLGVVLGGAAPAVMEKAVFPALGKAYNFAKGVMKPGSAEIERLGQKFGVPTTAGDASGSVAMRKAEVGLESVPLVGMGAFRQGQDRAAGTAATGMAQQLLDEMNSQGWSNLGQVQRAAQAGRKGAQALLDEIDAAGSDWTRILQASGNLKLFQGKLAADAAYDKVGQMAARHGEVPLTETTRVLEELRRNGAVDILPEESTAGVLNKIYTRLNAEAAVPAAQAGAQAVGGEVATAALPPQSMADTSFEGLRRLRSRLGGMIQDGKKGANAAVGTEGTGILERLRGAVENDMEAFAKSNGPELATAWRDADRIYKTQVVPFKDRALASAMKSATPDEIFDQFMKRGREGRAANFYEALDPKGQAAVRVGFVENAMEKALNSGAGDQAAIFSPGRFAKYLEDMRKPLGVALKGQDKWELDGLVKLMRHVERAGQFAENPPTGNRLMQLAVGGGLAGAAKFVDPWAAVGAWGAAKTAKVLLTSPAGKRLLLAASELPVGSKVMQDLVNNQLPKVLSRAVTPDPIANAYQFDQPQD